MEDMRIAKLKKRIEKLKKVNKKLEVLALKDSFTKVYNRTWFYSTIKQNAKYYLVFVDFNDLKLINDKYGHLEGDRYILKTVKILKKFGEVVRFGGDEFLVLTKDRENFQNLIDFKTDIFCTGGVEPEEYETISQALSIADKRLYVNKLNRPKRDI